MPHFTGPPHFGSADEGHDPADRGTSSEPVPDTDWFSFPSPNKYPVIIGGVPYWEDDIVPGSTRTFGDPWWAIIGPGGMTNWQVMGLGGETGETSDDGPDPADRGGPTKEEDNKNDEGDAVDAAWFDEFKKHFPGYARLLDAFPSLKTTVSDWWEDEKDSDYNQQYNSLLGAIKGTTWYEDHEEPLRDSYILQFTDPAQWLANLETNTFDLKSIAKQEGLYDYLNSRPGVAGFATFWDELADYAERGDWSEEQIRTRLVQEGLASPAAPVRGNIKRNMDRIKSYANSMLISMSDTDARKFATYMETTGGFYEKQGGGGVAPGTQIFRGSMSWSDVQDRIHGLAQNKWGFIDVDDLAERGMTVADTLTEVKEMIAGTLQLNLEDVNLMGIGVDDLIVGENEGEGKDSRRFMDIQEAENWAKRQSRYQMTDGFRGDVLDLGGSIAQAWGTR